jgi:integrase
MSAARRKSKRYPGYLERRGNTFWLSLCVAGQRHHFTVRTTDRLEAEAFAIAKRDELKRTADRRKAGVPGSIPFSELVALFKQQELPTLAEGTQSAYGDSLKPIEKYFGDELGDPQLDGIRAREIAAFLSWRRVNRLNGKDPVSNRTLQRDRAVLHRIFDLAERMEFREGNPVARVAAPKADPREPVILNMADYEKLVKACDGRPMLELYVITMGEAGLRCESEALQLRWADVDLDGGFLWVSSARERNHRTKSGKGRSVPMTPRLLAAMRAHFALYRFGGSEFVFHHLTSRWSYKAGARIKSLRHAFVNAAKRAKLPAELHQHDLRHRRVTTWLAEGRDVVLVKDAMGHADLKTTMGYTHLAKEHLRALVEPLERPRLEPKMG